MKKIMLSITIILNIITFVFADNFHNRYICMNVDHKNFLQLQYNGCYACISDQIQEIKQNSDFSETIKKWKIEIIQKEYRELSYDHYNQKLLTNHYNKIKELKK